ncbi:DNA repair protein RecO [Candidatus Giovannonibacteria bacterium RIFCSPLOWO2_02_FULL_43_11b]|uniref:DNA repair protein RecO n=1 Tax=Candidatus Giovannonibacteria bacterium RIFCSPHIGHO2_12_FULL_43_15 TaxID=1798341 RepID=A0A1F5WR04_9BACT|nr:MAG: DNA repair protein RecO [Candidatus Giovannonibacteria bacterium RIFCSPHIGHO2_02_FULL_43_32]OGF78098.1 MAG: DNA repair protein RecO [Candidatus Giovannonibacteria bacterium RIFCSPHIGHO2_12_FULL_43_15]OGF89165.1 MAG: DNA repair protein RecO [Candidatus Giovannonibacteria bacterium RIFCSPLOWO2_02_FULL_43_11b]OGF92343.1 MAG: DNA repair protein RecO [Candidatus Giovannonibacteria bacterium RIFCSPLOWO2_12_FULL_43_11c]
MSNGLYQTEGIILNSQDQGEADKVLTIYTKEFGMMRLFARGTRRASSKLNKFLNLFTYGKFGFVSGKDSWHLIDAEDLGHFDKIFEPEFGRVSNFIKRFSPGEGKEPKLWEAFQDFTRSGDELLFYAKALAVLGYLDEKEILDISRENLSQFIYGAIARSQL